MGKRKIVVFGSYINDFVGRGPGLPRPGETVKGSSFQIVPGGKGFNQAVAAKRAGGEVLMVTKVSRDYFGDLALANFEREGIETRYVFRDSESKTGAALIAVDEETGQNQILVTLGACGNISAEEIAQAKEEIEKAKLLLLQFETNMDAIETCIKIAHNAGVPIVLDPAPMQKLNEDILRFIEVLTPNEIEASALTGIEIHDEQDVYLAAQSILAKGVNKVIITLGSKGVYACTDEEGLFLPAVNFAPVVDTTGAGDAFNGALVTALTEGMDFFTAVKFSNIAASLSTTREGTSQSMPERSEIDRFFQV